MKIPKRFSKVVAICLLITVLFVGCWALPRAEAGPEIFLLPDFLIPAIVTLLVSAGAIFYSQDQAVQAANEWWSTASVGDKANISTQFVTHASVIALAGIITYAQTLVKGWTTAQTNKTVDNYIGGAVVSTLAVTGIAGNTVYSTKQNLPTLAETLWEVDMVFDPSVSSLHSIMLDTSDNHWITLAALQIYTDGSSMITGLYGHSARLAASLGNADMQVAFDGTDITISTSAGGLAFSVSSVGGGIALSTGYLASHDAKVFTAIGGVGSSTAKYLELKAQVFDPATMKFDQTYRDVNGQVGTKETGVLAPDGYAGTDASTMPYTPAAAPAGSATDTGTVTGWLSNLWEQTKALTDSLSTTISGAITDAITGVRTAVGDIATTVTGAISVALTDVVTGVKAITDTTTPANFEPLKVAWNTFTNKFPFSLPWDILHSFSSLSMANSFNPVINIGVADTTLLRGFNFNIDLTKFVGLLTIVRVIELLLFDIGLVMVTRRILGGDV
jgi:hypothetical protein